MALFGRSRDINLFHTVKSELIKDIIQTEVAYYKFALNQTTSNVYGESMGKVYYEPMKIAGLIDLQDQTWSSDDFGSDINQAIGVQFLKNELVTINLLPQVGDIILYFNNFYEVDTVIENQYIMGKDPNFALAQEILEHGDSFSIIINAHMSRVEKLNLIPLRGGVYPITDKPYGGIANT